MSFSNFPNSVIRLRCHLPGISFIRQFRHCFLVSSLSDALRSARGWAGSVPPGHTASCST